MQLEAKLATAEADKASAISTSERECTVAVAAAAAARERADTAEAEMEELRAAMTRTISGAREDHMGALHDSEHAALTSDLSLPLPCDEMDMTQAGPLSMTCAMALQPVMQAGSAWMTCTKACHLKSVLGCTQSARCLWA